MQWRQIMTTTSLMLVGSLLRITAANQATATRVTQVLRGRLQYEHDRRPSPSEEPVPEEPLPEEPLPEEPLPEIRCLMSHYPIHSGRCRCLQPGQLSRVPGGWRSQGCCLTSP